MSSVYGQQGSTTTVDDYNSIAFVFQMLMQKIQTGTLVKVISCTNDGGVSPVGKLTVQPLVNQMSGNRQPTPHGEIYNVVYARLTGGANAVIMDPSPGDIGFMGFCSRDISGVVAAMGQANPGSFRMFDFADGIYLCGVPLGVTPSQYIQFSDSGITIHSPTEITLDAPTVNVGTSGTVNIGNGNTTIDGKSMLGHVHSGVQTGGSDTGPVA